MRQSNEKTYRPVVKKWLLRSLVGLLLFGRFCPTLPAQTITVEGHIRDSLGRPVDLANVYATRGGDGGDIVAFALSDSSGFFILRATAPPGERRLYLRAGKLSYETASRSVAIPADGTPASITLDLVLREKAFYLREVVVSSDAPPVQVKKDTIIFQADAFADGREEVVEDLLRKLPGVAVGDNGEVTVNGKRIEKVMVENDDLFREGYALLTKNLSADVVDKVEVFQRYSDNPLLKGIEYSDKVALNLRLKKERMAPVFGNVDLGYGLSQVYESRINALSFPGKVKFFLLGSANNTGVDPGGDLAPSNGTGDEFTPEGPAAQPAAAQPLLALEPETPDLKKERYNRNNAEFGSLNIVCSPAQNLKIKSLLGLRFDEFRLRENRVLAYTTGNLLIREDKQYRRDDRDFFLHLDGTWTPGPHSRLAWWGAARRTGRDAYRNIRFQQDLFQERLDDRQYAYIQQMSYTKRLDDKRVLRISGSLSADQKPQVLQLDRFGFSGLFPAIDSLAPVRQLAGHWVSQYGVAATLIQNTEGKLLDLSLAYVDRTERLSSDLQFLPPDESPIRAGEAFRNHARQRLGDLSVTLTYRRPLNAKVSLGGILETHYIHHRLTMPEHNGGREAAGKRGNDLYLIPRLQVKWTPNEQNELALAYSRNRSNLFLPDSYPGFLLTDYRSFSRGTGAFDQLPSHFLLLNYTYGGWAKKQLINANIILAREKRYLGADYTITPVYNTSAALVLRNRDLRSANLMIDQFLERLSGNLKLKAGFSSSSFRNVLNDSAPRAVLIHTYSGGLEFRSAFTGGFNVHFGTDWTGTWVRKPVVQRNWTNRSFLDLLFRLQQRLYLELNTDIYWFMNFPKGKNTSLFSDLSIRYVLKRNGLSFRVVGKNLLNSAVFSSLAVDDIRTSGTEFSLVPRYILLKMMVRF